MDSPAVEDHPWSMQARNIHVERFLREHLLQVAVQLVIVRQGPTKRYAKQQESLRQRQAPVVPLVLDRWWSTEWWFLVVLGRRDRYLEKGEQ